MLGFSVGRGSLSFSLRFTFSVFLGFQDRRPGSGAQRLAAVANFGVYVDGKGGPGFFPGDVLPRQRPLTVRRPVDDSLWTGLLLVAAVFCSICSA